MSDFIYYSNIVWRNVITCLMDGMDGMDIEMRDRLGLLIEYLHVLCEWGLRLRSSPQIRRLYPIKNKAAI